VEIRKKQFTNNFNFLIRFYNVLEYSAASRHPNMIESATPI